MPEIYCKIRMIWVSSIKTNGCEEGSLSFFFYGFILTYSSKLRSLKLRGHVDDGYISNNVCNICAVFMMNTFSFCTRNDFFHIAKNCKQTDLNNIVAHIILSANNFHFRFQRETQTVKKKTQFACVGE